MKIISQAGDTEDATVPGCRGAGDRTVSSSQTGDCID